MDIKLNINTFVDTFFTVWNYYKRDNDKNKNLIIKGVNGIIIIKGEKVFDNNDTNFAYVRDKLDKVIKGMDLNPDIDYMPTIELEYKGEDKDD